MAESCDLKMLNRFRQPLFIVPIIFNAGFLFVFSNSSLLCSIVDTIFCQCHTQHSQWKLEKEKETKWLLFKLARSRVVLVDYTINKLKKSDENCHGAEVFRRPYATVVAKFTTINFILSSLGKFQNISRSQFSFLHNRLCNPPNF